MLEEAESALAKRQEEKEKRRLQLKELRKADKGRKMDQLRGLTLEGLAEKAAQRDEMFEKGKAVENAATERCV